MPTTIPELTYLGLSTFIALVIGVGFPTIAWLMRAGFRALISKIESMDDRIGDLSTELRQEREDRIRYYGDLKVELAIQKAEFAAHLLRCKEKHSE